MNQSPKQSANREFKLCPPSLSKSSFARSNSSVGTQKGILGPVNISRSCKILVTFSPETSEFTLLTIAPFVAIRQKSAYHAKYLRMFWTYLDLLYRFGRHISGDDFRSIHLVVAEGTLLWQPVKYGRRSQTSRGTTFTLCFSIRQRIG